MAKVDRLLHHVAIALAGGAGGPSIAVEVLAHPQLALGGGAGVEGMAKVPHHGVNRVEVEIGQAVDSCLQSGGRKQHLAVDVGYPDPAQFAIGNGDLGGLGLGHPGGVDPAAQFGVGGSPAHQRGGLPPGEALGRVEAVALGIVHHHAEDKAGGDAFAGVFGHLAAIFEAGVDDGVGGNLIVAAQLSGQGHDRFGPHQGAIALKVLGRIVARYRRRGGNTQGRFQGVGPAPRLSRGADLVEPGHIVAPENGLVGVKQSIAVGGDEPRLGQGSNAILRPVALNVGGDQGPGRGDRHRFRGDQLLVTGGKLGQNRSWAVGYSQQSPRPRFRSRIRPRGRQQRQHPRSAED